MSANTCGSTLAPKPATCMVSVTFNPTGASNPKNTKEPGTLTITDDAEKSPQTVQLKGIAFGITPGPATIFVSNTFAASVTAYPIGSNGDVAPTATISGNCDGGAGVGCGNGIALDGSGNIYVAKAFGGPDVTGSIDVYPTHSNGDVTPKAIISGARTKLYYPGGVAVSSTGKIYVANAGSESGPDGNGYVTVYPAGSNGDVAPTAVIGGSNTGLNQPVGIALNSSGKLFVANNETQPPCCGSVTVYPAGSNGNVRPSVSIAGGNTGLYFPSGIALDASGNIYVANDWGEPDGIGFITVYPAGSHGDAAPSAAISPVSDPYSIALDSDGNIYVASYYPQAEACNPYCGNIVVYSAGSKGDATPSAVIGGSSTGLAGPQGIVISP